MAILVMFAGPFNAFSWIEAVGERLSTILVGGYSFCCPCADWGNGKDKTVRCDRMESREGPSAAATQKLG